MNKILGGIIIALGLMSSAQASCVISSTPGNQFCLEMYKLSEEQTVEVKVDGTSPNDFEARPVFGYMKVIYKGQITAKKSGKILIKDKSGSVVSQREIILNTTNHLDGYNKVMKGTATILKELGR